MVTESIEEINLADYLVTSTWKCTIFLGGHFAQFAIDLEVSLYVLYTEILVCLRTDIDEYLWTVIRL